ncbi:hypothetical protein J6A31_00995 [bacterium]|nr:hypothetical protein [bacterium]
MEKRDHKFLGILNVACKNGEPVISNIKGKDYVTVCIQEWATPNDWIPDDVNVAATAYNQQKARNSIVTPEVLRTLADRVMDSNDVRKTETLMKYDDFKNFCSIAGVHDIDRAASGFVSSSDSTLAKGTPYTQTSEHLGESDLVEFKAIPYSSMSKLISDPDRTIFGTIRDFQTQVRKGRNAEQLDVRDRERLAAQLESAMTDAYSSNQINYVRGATNPYMGDVAAYMMEPGKLRFNVQCVPPGVESDKVDRDCDCYENESSYGKSQWAFDVNDGSNLTYNESGKVTQTYYDAILNNLATDNVDIYPRDKSIIHDPRHLYGNNGECGIGVVKFKDGDKDVVRAYINRLGLCIGMPDGQNENCKNEYTVDAFMNEAQFHSYMKSGDGCKVFVSPQIAAQEIRDKFEDKIGDAEIEVYQYITDAKDGSFAGVMKLDTDKIYDMSDPKDVKTLPASFVKNNFYTLHSVSEFAKGAQAEQATRLANTALGFTRDGEYIAQSGKSTVSSYDRSLSEGELSFDDEFNMLEADVESSLDAMFK